MSPAHCHFRHEHRNEHHYFGMCSFHLPFCVKCKSIDLIPLVLKQCTRRSLGKDIQLITQCCSNQAASQPADKFLLMILSSQAYDLLGYKVCSDCLCSSMYGITSSSCWRTSNYACIKEMGSSTVIDFSSIIPLPPSFSS